MGEERVDLGFGKEVEKFDPSQWAPKPKPVELQPTKAERREVAEAAGFRSREPARTRRPIGRPRTNRNVQLSMKVSQPAADMLYEIYEQLEGEVPYGEIFRRGMILYRQEVGLEDAGEGEGGS